ncbi:hypothetical protein F5144DRAFT_574451 [Chaetomium tenue]|uniref:Uncharacterized protein n=1 Tax=Chaetomium tenue TaxID=1854479 RepID=A0ACB7P9D2_9PEZI|nr:hypothetical protein F5144DRAFT_574451 [Chaetomium globosum]
MAFPISPRPSSTRPSMCISHMNNIIKQLTRHRLGDAFEALLDLGDEMHDMVDDLGGLSDLHQVDRLLTYIVHHSAYGVYDHVDQVINTLVLLALRTCDRLKSADIRLGPDMVFWLSPTQSEIDDHLEVYRNFLGYITACIESPSSQDPNLQSARQLLQRLRPRINTGVYRWTRPKGVDHGAKTDAVARRHSLRSSTQRQRSGMTKPFLPRPQPPRKPAAGFMPTPSPQSGDVGFEVTLPTIPVYGRGRAHPEPAAPLSDPLSNTMGRESCSLRGANEVVDKMVQPFVPPSELVGLEGGRCRTERRNVSNIGMPHHDAGTPITPVAPIGTFKLRPEHSCSSRCCPLR